MPATITAPQLAEALHHALGRVHEFDDGDIDMKLAVFGLQTQAVADLLEQRWTAYRDEHTDSADSHVLFVRGFVEGLLTGLQLSQR